MQRARYYNLVLFTAILCLAAGAFFGCSTQKRHNLLTFFFDGVPAPGGLAGTEAKLASYLHRPYAEGKCGACHGSDDIEMSIARPVNIAAIPSTICMTCHDQVRTAYPVMHGPVAASECMQCHSPHESSIVHLMKMPAPRVCVQCHAPENMDTERPEHKDLAADCLSCHVAHGGAKHGLLRAGYSPTTRPAVSTLSPGTAGDRL